MKSNSTGKKTIQFLGLVIGVLILIGGVLLFVFLPRTKSYEGHFVKDGESVPATLVFEYHLLDQLSGFRDFHGGIELSYGTNHEEYIMANLPTEHADKYVFNFVSEYIENQGVMTGAYWGEVFISHSMEDAALFLRWPIDEETGYFATDNETFLGSITSNE